MFKDDKYKVLRKLWSTYKGTGVEFDILIAHEGWSNDVLYDISEVLNHAIMTKLKIEHYLMSLLSEVHKAKLSK